jgi:hypothetical protein
MGDIQFIQYQPHFQLQQKIAAIAKQAAITKISYCLNEEKPYQEPLVLKELVNYQNLQSL